MLSRDKVRSAIMKDPSSSSQRALENIERLARLMRSAGHSLGLVPAQWDVLRYFARANRFSDSPIAAAHYLGTTKGTISQTILGLVRKGLLKSQSRGSDARSVAVGLTDKGKDLATRDPLAALGQDLVELKEKTAKHFGRAVEELLKSETQRQAKPNFGACVDCRFFLNGREKACASFGERLLQTDLDRLCYKFRASKSEGKNKKGQTIT